MWTRSDETGNKDEKWSNAMVKQYRSEIGLKIKEENGKAQMVKRGRSGMRTK
jgi:hypothetical protein